MEPTDLTIEILKDIRAGIETTHERVDSLKTALGSLREDTNARLDLLSRRIVESEVRTSTAIVDLAEAVRDVAMVLRAQSGLAGAR